MPAKKTYDRAAKRNALILWVLLSICLNGLLIVPLYWFWEPIFSRHIDKLIIICVPLVVAWWNWWKLSVRTIGIIRNLPEKPAA